MTSALSTRNADCPSINVCVAGIDRGNQHGFTLLELMIVGVVMTLLIIIAVPVYREQGRELSRNEAWRALEQALQCHERSLAVSLGKGTPNPEKCLPATGQNYRYSLIEAEDVFQRFGGFRASPLGAQSLDSCGILALTDAGQRRSMSSDGTPLPCPDIG